MKYTLKRKAGRFEVKHLTKILGFEMNEVYVIIPVEYAGVVRMYQQDGLI